VRLVRKICFAECHKPAERGLQGKGEESFGPEGRRKYFDQGLKLLRLCVHEIATRAPGTSRHVAAVSNIV
jgi:hypothetical protein